LFAQGPVRKVDYNREIRPLLSNVCYKCHGPDEKERKAGLRLDSSEGLTARLESGAHAVIAGKSAESELFKRLVATDPAEKMPPTGSDKQLTPQQIELIKRWIDEGATTSAHWAFVPPRRPALPAVKNESQVRNAIDRFIISRLDQEGLAPAPEADRVTLIRRLTFDLTGLPPTPAEVDAFVGDQSGDAYERLIERLLSSSRFGEHQARYWLDAARYGDSHGLHFDNERSMWLYREWVIQAFNRNLPFDQFTIEQLAGDLLPNATIEQKIASGFNRCNVTTSEGGSIDEEVLVRYNVDRVETTATVFMGLTLGCSVCHDHKYDPFTQKEFYQLYSFFNSLAENAMDGNANNPPPYMKVPAAEQLAAIADLDKQVAATRQKIAEELARVEYVEPAATEPTAVGNPQEYVWIEDDLPPQAKPQGDTPWQFVNKADKPVFSGERASTRTAAGLSQHYFTDASPALKVGEGDKFFAYVYLDPANPPQQIMLQWNDGSWEHRATWGGDMIPWGAPNTPSRQAMGPLPEVGKWVRLEVECSKVGIAPGTNINGWAFTQFAGTVYWDKVGLITRTPQAGQSFESQIAWEAYEKAQSKSTLPGPVQEALKVETDKRNDAQKKVLRDHFLEFVCGRTKPVFDALHQQITAAEQKRKAIDDSIPGTMVSGEMAQKRDAFLLIRGQYDKKGEKVGPGVPAALSPFPKDAPLSRLGLAQWLVAPEHPLTARVNVNRFWQQMFGTGIVKTAEDFGAQGQWPSHPELLDWLSVEFRESGWNVKHLLKLIAMSATYRQSSRTTPELIQRDPANELLARGPRFRLDAEVIRDSALAASGLLVEKIGGRSVKPYQPEGLWEAISFVGSNTGTFKQDSGDSLYRRSLYTFWKRTSPPPSLLTFDAPSREACTVRRSRTNTPLQALVLLNDKQYVEAARKLAERGMSEGGASPADRAVHMFRLATGRRPSAPETSVLLKVYESELAEFQADSEAAGKLLAVGDAPRNAALDVPQLAAWTLVANLVLNLDESVTKE
ncbi:MAG: PSD1 domain-containing protein, partial [Planctomycetes bacterium]|nr:PSD1 domain-containing protein [Planctomycetota bacterium]